MVTTRTYYGLALAALTAVASPAAQAELRVIEDAIEGAELYLEPGNPPRIRAAGCQQCPATFVLAEDFRVYVDGDRVEQDQWQAHQGRSGTLIYDIESERAVRLRW